MPEIAFSDSAIGASLLTLQRDGSGSQRQIADYLLRNPVRIVAWSIEELAGGIGVSTATLSRFARAAGFASYPQMRHAIAETLQSVLLPVDKLRDRLERAGPLAAAVTEGLETTLANLRHTAGYLDVAVIDDVVRRIGAARAVYVMGFGLSAHLAALLTLGLQPFCPALVNVVEFGGTETAAGRMMNLGPQDVLLAISLPRYARDIVQLMDFARDRGAHLVAITDSPASPLARRAHSTLIAASHHPVLSSSVASAMLVIEALVAAMMVSNPDNLRNAERLTDAIASYLYTAEGAPQRDRG